MSSIHLIHFLVALLIALAFWLLLARGAYWRGKFEAAEDHREDLGEEIHYLREQFRLTCNSNERHVDFIKGQHERFLMEKAAPELLVELEESNELLRSLHAVAERDGVSTDWESLSERLKQRLKTQHRMLHTEET